MRSGRHAKPAALLLVIAIPLLSVASGAVMFYLAHREDASVPLVDHTAAEQTPLTKTSWRGAAKP
ncbi:MAG: hypothetical protein ACR2PZ_08590 [Pseudomonadales bacterium]